MTDKEFEKLVEKARPSLKAIQKNSPPVTKDRIQKLLDNLDAIEPFLRLLTKQKMRKLILEVLKAHPMEGTELTALLRKNNVKMKDAAGDGEIYGLLRQLETAGEIEGKWKDGLERRKKVYKLTDAGRSESAPATTEEFELAGWLLARMTS